MSTLDTFAWILVISSLGLLFWFLLFGRISDDQAKELIEDGAIVIDVRPSAKYSQKQLEGTVNFPIGSVVKAMESLAKEKPRTILCHCESGGLSAIAVSQLRRAGYIDTYNLGSYRRAAAILKPVE